MPIEKQKNNALLLCLSLSVVWGLGYILVPLGQRAGATSSFLCFLRFLLSGLIYGAIFIRKIKIKAKDLPIGLIAGMLLAVSFALQAYGQEYTTPSNSAFLTSMTTVFLPFLTWIFFRKKPSVLVYVSLAAYVAGVFVLSYNGSSFVLNLGDILILTSALTFALHYIAVTYALKRTDSQTFNFLQLTTAGIILGVFFFAYEFKTQIITPIAWGSFIFPLLALVLFSTVYAYSVQTHAQKLLPPYQVSLVLSLENVFGAAFSVIFGFEAFRINMVFGGALMFGAVILAQVVPSLIKRKQSQVKLRAIYGKGEQPKTVNGTIDKQTPDHKAGAYLK